MEFFKKYGYALLMTISFVGLLLSLYFQLTRDDKTGAILNLILASMYFLTNIIYTEKDIKRPFHGLFLFTKSVK